MQSATTYDSLGGVFCYKPFDAKVDWSMVAKASPCYMTVCFFSISILVTLQCNCVLIVLFWQYMGQTIDQIIKFFQSNTVSQAIALETAAAVQV